MKRIPVLLFFLSVMLHSCKDEKKKQQGPEPGSEPKPVHVDGIIARETGTSSQISTTGTILANEEVEVKSEVTGKIISIRFKEGSVVAKGQLLVQLQDDDLSAQLEKLNIEIRLQEEKEARQKKLLASSAISREEYDVTKTNLDLLKANVEILNTQIDKTKITAPFTGIIGLKNVSEGAIISQNTVIASIQNLQPLKMDFSIPEKYSHLVDRGSRVKFTVAGASEELSATVYAKEPKIDLVTRTARVRATFTSRSGKILPGAFAEVTIPLGKMTNAIMVPTVAYIPDINGAKVLVCKNGQAQNVPVTAGIRTPTEIQILSGIAPGDTVLVSGILQLKPKTPVTVNIIGQDQ